MTVYLKERDLETKDIFFYETQLGRHKLDLGTATTTSVADYASSMIERCEIALDELQRGTPKNKVWKFYQTGHFD